MIVTFRRILSTLTVVVLLPALGCAMRSQTPHPTLSEDLNQLQAELDTLPPFPEPAPESGSLWTNAGPGAAMVRDTSAFRINDLLTVVLRESSSGSSGATTELSKQSDTDYAAPFVLGASFADPLLRTSMESDFVGDGTTERGNRLSATITGRVIRVLPNGDLVVAGQKTVMVNRERQVLTVVGSVRPVDIDSYNRISSSDVGNLTVRLWGIGEVDDTARQGWFMRIVNRLWPF